MTCVIGISEGGQVLMGADSLSASGYDVTMRRDPKLFQKGPFLIGFTDSYRMGQILRFNMAVEPPSESDDLFAYMATKFVDAARSALREGGWTMKHDERESGGQFLVGLRGHLFVVESDFQVSMPHNGYEAVGCGAPYALGALYATEGEGTARDRIEIGLSAAAEFSAGVRGPWVILESAP